MQTSLAEAFNRVFGSPSLPEAVASAAPDRWIEGSGSIFKAHNMPYKFRITRDGSGISSLLFLAKLDGFVLGEQFPELMRPGSSHEADADLAIVEPWAVLSWRRTAIEAADDVPAHLRVPPLSDGLQIIGARLSRSGSEANIWAYDKGSYVPAKTIPGSLHPDTRMSCDAVTLRVGLAAPTLSIDGWWVHGGTPVTVDAFDRFQFDAMGRSKVLFIDQTANPLPVFQWIWRAALPEMAHRFFFFANETTTARSTIGCLIHSPVPLGTGTEFITSRFGNLPVKPDVDTIPVFLDGLSFAEGSSYGLVFSLGSAEHQARPLIKIADDIALRQVSLEVFSFKSLGQAVHTNFTFSGLIALYGTDFEVKFSPGNFVTGKIGDRSSIPIGKLIENIGGITLPFGLTTLSLSEAEMSRDFKARSSYFGLGVTGEVPLIDGVLALQGIRLHARFFQGSAEKQLFVEARARLFDLIGLTASATLENNSWSFYMAGEPGDGCTMKELAEKITSNASLPAFIEGLQLKDFSLLYETGLRNLTLKAAIDWPLPIGKDGSDVHLLLSALIRKTQGAWSFSLEAEITEPIAVSQLIAKLVAKMWGGAAPPSIPVGIDGLIVKSVQISFDTQGNVELALQTAIQFEGKELDLWIDMKKDGARFVLAGSLYIEGFKLDLAFESESRGPGQSSDRYVVASISYPIHVDSRQLLEALAPHLLPYVPIDVEVDLKGLLLAFHDAKGQGAPQGGVAQGGASREYLFRLQFSLHLGLDRLPLIGRLLPKGLGFTNAQLLAANRTWKDEQVQEINSLLGAFPTPPDEIARPKGSPAGASLVGKGITLSGSFKATDAIQFPLYLSLGGDKAAALPAGQDGGRPVPGGPVTAAPTSAPAQPGAQQNVGKTFGPVNFRKVELIFKGGRIGLKLTGGLGFAAFEFELLGLEVTVPQSVLSDPSKLGDVHFGLDGFAIDIHRGTLAISGAFLRRHYPASTDPENGRVTPAHDEFNGIVRVLFPPFSLCGMGSYAELDGHPSLFLFVALGFPLTVHPALVITGMSLGFGVHRDFVPPAAGQILDYPLVQAAVTPPPEIRIDDMVTSMHRYFPPRLDEYFVVGGVKFRALGLVESLVMLSVKFGREMEINLIGVSSVLLPATFIELAWMARFRPEEGYFLMSGQLTSRSYLFVPPAKLSGGFAVAFWTRGEHKGDFAISVGGYHPKFSVPAHYPNSIPRLGINFGIGSVLTVKGAVYFAVTPRAIMMGGSLDGTLSLGSISGYLRVTADLIIEYQPFHYDAMLSVDAGVKMDIPMLFCTLHLDVHLHADMHVWGPEFAGTAYLDLGVATVAVQFGEKKAAPAPLSWPEFKEKFLPPDQVCGVAVTRGLIRHVKTKTADGEVWVVNPKELALEASSVVPLSSAVVAVSEVESELVTAPAGFYSPGITPMNAKRLTRTELKITLKPNQGAAAGFKYDLMSDRVPAAIWGDKGLASGGAPSAEGALLDNALTGVRIMRSADAEAPPSHAMESGKLAFNTDQRQLPEVFSAWKLKAVSREREAVSAARPKDAFSDWTGLSPDQLHESASTPVFLAEPLLVELHPK